MAVNRTGYGDGLYGAELYGDVVYTENTITGNSAVRVDRPDEGLPGIATIDNPTANPPSRNLFDTGMALLQPSGVVVAQIDTSGNSGLQMGDAVKRARPNAW